MKCLTAIVKMYWNKGMILNMTSFLRKLTITTTLLTHSKITTTLLDIQQEHESATNIYVDMVLMNCKPDVE